MSACIACLVCRIRAVTDAYASQQPLFPQEHCSSPSALIMMCPSSPPAQLKPRYGLPSMITPPPTPVPSVIKTKLSASSPFTAYSPNAAAFASFSKLIRLPSLFSSIAPNSVFFIRILHAYATIPFLLSTVPGQPIPIDLISDI